MSRAFLVLALLLGTNLAADELGDLRRKLAQEANPANRAKLTVKLGERLLRQARKLYAEGAYTDGDLTLESYRSALRTAVTDLHQSGRRARRKPKGFKALEIHLRKNHRKVRDMARGLPLGARDTAEATVQEMESLQRELLRALMGVEQKKKEEEEEEKR